MGQMLLGWCVVPHLVFSLLTEHTRFSASNGAKLYELAMKQDYLTGSAWAFGTKLMANHVWDGFIIMALLDDHKQQGTYLQVPHIGEQKDQPKAAMVAHNNWIVFNGQPDAVRHVCAKCMWIYEISGKFSKITPLDLR